jgi:hypothetical protein
MLRHTTDRVSRRTALAGLGAGGLGVALAAPGTRVAAQEASTDALAGHPLVGTWLAITPFGASPETFAADGTVIEAGDQGVTFYGPGIGVWTSTGERSGAFTFVQALGHADGAYAGTLTIDGHLDVSEDGQSFVDDAPETTLTFRDAQNNVLQAINPFKPGEGSLPLVTAIRMAVGAPGFPPGAAGTPTA